MDKLLLLLSSFSNPQKNAVCATLAWMAEDAGWSFDVYYDAFRTGDHFGGGPIARAERGRAFGSTMSGHAHMEAFYRLLATYECHAVRLGESCFDPVIEDLKIPVIACGGNLFQMYAQAARLLGAEVSRKLILLGGAGGEEAYLFPVIHAERALAVRANALLDAADATNAGIQSIAALLCTQGEAGDLQSRGFDIACVNTDYPSGDLAALSKILSERLSGWCKGYFLGDPVAAAHFLPYLLKTRRLALYGEPLKPLITSAVLPALASNRVVYGRMFNDEDALELSRAGGCWQLVDPGRPPFPAASRAAKWQEPPFDLFDYIDSYARDEVLEEHAARGDILASLVFWSGCVREMENFYRLNDLIAAAGFKCGVAVTTETFAQGAQSPFGAIALPRERGGVFPLAEPLLASSGLGFSLESYVPEGAFGRHIDDAARALASVAPSRLRPKGWWACLDVELEPDPSPDPSLRGRPFGAFRAGAPRERVHQAIAAHGFAYGVSKTGERALCAERNSPLYLLPQNAGSWQGWSPFHAIEGVEDVKRAEKALYLRGAPGYLLGTVDACLWTFSLPHWEKGGELKTMIDFMLHGGRTGRLVNAHPYAVYRYARYLDDHGYAVRGSAAKSSGAALRWTAMRARQGARALLSKRR
ncbi:MAG: hypothetical protein HY770_08730 [Chitinivibrionia bacterium]|nr:hypothetical protein [Chitinivibrionia bacterium]